MRSWIAAVICCLLFSSPGAPSGFAVTPEIQKALDAISPDDLRGNLSFLASDLLEGRGTPSRGLDIAAEFIASRFRAAGLEPGAGDGYFQDAKFMVREPDLKDFACKLENGGETLTIDSSQVHIRGEK